MAADSGRDKALPPSSLSWIASAAEAATSTPLQRFFCAGVGAGVAEMLTNWAAHVIKLGMGGKMLIAAFDEELLGTLRELGLPAYNYTGVLPPHHFRRAPYLFHRMGYLKATLIQQVCPPSR